MPLARHSIGLTPYPQGSLRELWQISFPLIISLMSASMMLFLENAEARGRNADMLQLRRLGWLMLFGQAHKLVHAIGRFIGQTDGAHLAGGLPGEIGR